MAKGKRTKPRSWIEVRVEVPSALAEPMANFLIESGSPGVVQEKVTGKPGAGKERVIAYFRTPRSFPVQRKRIRKYLSSLAPAPGSWSFRWRGLREEKWAEAWKDNFKPLRVTPKMVVKPPWERYAGKAGELVIEIDPGMAFGTGTHPTTRMCLQALEVLIPSFVHPPSVLDFGTGSGILAIAAQMLGARDTVAVDIDPAAIRNARKNASANRLHGRIDFRVGSGQSLRGRFGIVVANLLPQELLNAADFLARRVSPAGYLVLSGILKKQEKEISSAFAEKGLKIHASKAGRGWICLVFKRKRLSGRFTEVMTSGKAGGLKNREPVKADYEGASPKGGLPSVGLPGVKGLARRNHGIFYTLDGSGHPVLDSRDGLRSA